jgi:tetratricopeptide (TPR) repeat protein
MAGRRAMDAGAFEEALETFDHLIGLELGEDDPFLAEAFERRGNALVGLQRSEEAIDALDKALVLYSARRDDAGIARSAQPLSFFNFVRGNFSEAVTVLNRGLEALSNEAQAERAVLQAVLAINHSLTAKLDEAWLTTNEAAATAEQLADPYVMGRVLSAKVYVQRNCLEMDAAIETGRQALALLRPEALWDRVDLMVAMSVDYSWAGHYAEAEVLLTELASIASRIGHHTAILVSKFGTAVQEMFRTGDLRATLAEAEGNRATRRATVPVLMQLLDSWLAGIHLYLGDIDRAIELLNGVMKGHRLQYNLGAAEGNLFLLNALAGRVDPARTLFSAVERFLPALAHRNVCGAWWALETAVVGLALVGDTERCGALYPSTLAYVDTGFVCAASTLGPGTPQLSAAIAAHAAGLDEKARAHFEIAAQQARDLPYRILQPTVQLWHGRMLAEQNDPSDQSRGRAMIEAAAADFRGLEMVLHADLAERFLRSG